MPVPCSRSIFPNPVTWATSPHGSPTLSETPSTSSVEGSPASPSLLPENGSPKMTHDGYGLIAGELFASYDLSLSSWKTSQGCLFEEWAKFSGAWPISGMMRNGRCYKPRGLVYPKTATGFSLSPIPHETIPRRYFIKTPSMLSAIARGWMVPVERRPTLTTKITERAPCPYWETPRGPRYLTEVEAERMMGYPDGWTMLDTSASAIASSRKLPNGSSAKSKREKKG